MPARAAHHRGFTIEINHDRPDVTPMISLLPAAAITDALGSALAERLSRIDTVPDRELSVLAWQMVGEVGGYSTAAALPDGWQITIAERTQAVLASHRGTLLDAVASPEPRTVSGFATLVAALVGSLELPIE